MAGENTKGKRKRSTAHSVKLNEEKERRRQHSLNLIKRSKDHPLPELTEEDRIKYDKSALRDHLGIGEEHPRRTTVLFFVELTPHSTHRGAACQHVTCKDRIEEDSYRVAVHPGKNNLYKNADFYHVRCFEALVDFSQEAYLDRIQPVTRCTARMRGLKGSSIADGNYLVDGGAERLILEWKTSMGKLMDRRDEVPIEPMEPDFDDLLHKSGSASYQSKSIDGMTRHEFFNLSINLAPIESDGVEDQEEWNLFEQYLPSFTDMNDLKEPHSLSDMLGGWKADQFLACANEDRLTDKGKEEKEKLGEKAIRAISRLSSIPMPDFQAAFLGGIS